MGLFGDKTELALSLDSPQVVAGQALLVRVKVGEPDKKAQGGHVELVYRNTFDRDEHTSNGSGSSSGLGNHGQRQRRSHSEDVQVVSRPMASGGTVVEGESVIELPVPRDAPASSSGTVTWEVRAVVDRKKAMDATAESQVAVVSPAGALEAWTRGSAQSEGRCEFDIDVARREVRPGQPLAGTVTLRPVEDATARAVKAQLHMVRQDQDGHTKEKTVGEVVLASDLELQSGTPWTSSFEVTVPADAAPSFDARYNSQHWFLEVVVDRKRAGDYVGRLEVVVHAG